MKYTEKDRFSTNQRYEIVLDNGEDYNKWSVLTSSTDNVVSGTLHITGSQSVGFDKINGSTTYTIVGKTIDKINGYDLDMFSAEGQILTSLYIPDISDVKQAMIYLGSSTSISNFDNITYFVVDDADLSAGWNNLKLDCSEPTGQIGCGVDWRHVRQVLVGVDFDAAADTLADMLVDSVRVNLPTSSFSFDPNIDNISVGSVSLGTDAANTARTTATLVLPTQQIDQTGKVSPAGDAVGNAPFCKLTDGTNTAGINPANTARSTATVVQTVQNVDASGKVPPAGDIVGNAPFCKLTDGTNTAAFDAADTARSTATIVLPVQPVDANGDIITGGSGGGGGGNMIYLSPEDFTAAYNAADSVILTGLSWTPTVEQFIKVTKIDSTGLATSYTPSSNTFNYVSGTGVLTVGGSPTFSATDLGYRVEIYGPDKYYNKVLDSSQTVILNPINQEYSFETVAAVTNEADASSDYYVDMSSYRACMVQYLVQGGTDVIALKVYGTLQADGTAAASCLYNDVTQSGMDILSWTTTSGSYDVSTILKTVGDSSWKYLKFNVAKTGGSNDADYTIYIKKYY